jgi:YbgC/YbaW family acyl-CoA thioester hydrolase
MPSEFTLTRQVEFHETDMAGIMHFSNFFRWMEVCETTFYRSLGLPLIAFVPGQVAGWPRVQASCEYRAPLRFADVVEVRLYVKRLGARSVTYAFRFRKGDVVVASGEITAVCVKSDATGAMVAQPLPPEVRERLQEAPASVIAASGA